MKHLDGLLNVVDKEFGEIEASGRFRSKDEIELAYKLIDIAKDVYEILKCEEEMDGGYSGSSYDDGYSAARGRMRAKRDGMGRYSRDDYRGVRHGYSRTDAKEEYLDNLRDMMKNAPDENARHSIQRMIDQMEN